MHVPVSTLWLFLTELDSLPFISNRAGFNVYSHGDARLKKPKKTFTLMGTHVLKKPKKTFTLMGMRALKNNWVYFHQPCGGYIESHGGSRVPGSGYAGVVVIVRPIGHFNLSTNHAWSILCCFTINSINGKERYC
jgi:hypothetical protein